jgi:2-oxoglutarate dehydrogenase complex dehydrogenase (E1) component-like enzyme
MLSIFQAVSRRSRASFKPIFSKNHGFFASLSTISYTEEAIRNRVENSNLVRLVDAYRRYGHILAHINPLYTGPLM